eukprot:1006887-Pelagomonas_calceolata.AAC.9
MALKSRALEYCCAMFVLSLFDKMWRPDITQAEALDMMEQVHGGTWHAGAGERQCEVSAWCIESKVHGAGERHCKLGAEEKGGGGAS